MDAAEGLSDADLAMLADRGLGFTNVVARPTARAAELDAAEMREGGRILGEKVARQRERRGGPDIVLIVGIGAYRTAFGAPRATVGKQTATVGGAETWVAPNPSGLNAHETVASLALAYAEPAREAGVLPR